MKLFFMILEIVLMICTFAATIVALRSDHWTTAIALGGVTYLLGTRK
jgi:hypothetical protein